MQKVSDKFNDFCFFNMDDVLVHNASKPYVEHLKMIFQKDQKSRLETKTLEICIFKRNLQNVGCSISGEGILSLKEKVEIVLDLASPEM